MICAVCNLPIPQGTSKRYALGRIEGRLCPVCFAGMDGALTRWMAQRMREVGKEQAAAEREQFANERLARRCANEQLRLQRALRDELFPELVRPVVREGTAAE